MQFFTQFICHYFSYSFNISSETHAIFMYIYVSYLTQKMIKNAIVFRLWICMIYEIIVLVANSDLMSFGF
jgi:hypothetical protein